MAKSKSKKSKKSSKAGPSFAASAGGSKTVISGESAKRRKD